MTDTVSWDLDRLFQPPACEPATGFEHGRLRPVFYDALPWRGQSTRVFAWIGMPANASAEPPVPGVVLIHGGGGTAFPEWVEHWNHQGYAAIAMDTAGCVTGGSHGDRPRHDQGGPRGYGGWDQLDEPIEDQWMYHALADVMLARSLLASLPEVDDLRIGLTGISWGGILAANLVGIDHRYRFAVPVYGCGFLGEYDSRPDFLVAEDADPGRVARWKRLWDARHRLPHATMPVHWVNGADDIAFSLPSMYESSKLTAGPSTLTFQRNLPHGHEAGWAPPEIIAFADAHCRDGAPLPRFEGLQLGDGRITGRVSSQSPLECVELIYTQNDCPWRQRQWAVQTVDPHNDCLDIAMPPFTGCFINVTDARGLTASSDLLGQW